MNNANSPSRSPAGSGMNPPRESVREDYNLQNGGTQEGARGMAAKAGEKLMDTAEKQKQAGADFMSNMADAVRRAAGEFDGESPQAARYIRYAADQMDALSDTVRRRDLNQMMSEVQSFARRQPTAFLGATFLAGFAAMRFLRSSAPAERRYSHHDEWRRDETMGDPMHDDRYGTPSGASGAGTSSVGGSGMANPGMGSAAPGTAAMRPPRETSHRSGM